MAIAFGGISAVSTSQTPTSVAVSGSDTIGIVFVVGTTTTDLITAVTWGGVAMTKIDAIQSPGDRWISAWWIANPGSSQTISFTGGSFWRSYSMYYTGAKQVSPIDAFNKGSTASANTLSIANTVVAANCWLLMGIKAGGGTSTAAGSLASMRVSADAGALAIGDSNGTVAAGSRTATINQSSTVQIGGIAFSIAPAGATIYTLTAAAASFALTGMATALKRIRRMTAASGAFVLTGNATALRRNVRMTASTASFTLAGIAAELKRTFKMTLGTGTFTLTGFDAELTPNKVLDADPGTFTLTGNAVALRREIRMQVVTGSFALTGTIAQLTCQRRLNADSGQFVLSGNDVQFIFPQVFTLNAEAGAFALIGYGASLGLSLPKPLWVNEAIPGGAWAAGQSALLAGDTFFDGFMVYAGQLGIVSAWESETGLDDEDTPEPYWAYEGIPGGSWLAGQPSLLAGDVTYDGLEVYAGQLGQASSWEHEVQ